jgi:hypothetical protein
VLFYKHSECKACSKWCALSPLLLLLLQFSTAQALVHITPAAYLATTLLSVLSTLQGFVGGFTRPMPATPVVSWLGC